jgi:hypothetical protein
LSAGGQARASASRTFMQLNFLRHIFTILKQHGRAAVVLEGKQNHLILNHLAADSCCLQFSVSCI